MRILVIEDEGRIAKRIERLCKEILGKELSLLKHCSTIFEGEYYLETHPVDLLILDLNLNGEDGFRVLQNFIARSFHTIIISAYKERAITAFEYGVLDFIPKPFNKQRLEKAFAKMLGENRTGASSNLKFLSIKKKGRLHFINIEDLLYIKGAGIYSELILKNGNREFHDKSLEKLAQILPYTFERIHKSYLVDMRAGREIIIQTGSKYALVLKNEEVLPIGRTRYKGLKERWLG